jgi:hypothetical protein
LPNNLVNYNKSEVTIDELHEAAPVAEMNFGCL